MANLQVKRVPEDVHRKLQRRAKRRGVSLRDVVLGAIRRELALEEFEARLERRTPVDLGVRAAELLDDERAARERGS